MNDTLSRRCFLTRTSTGMIGLGSAMPTSLYAQQNAGNTIPAFNNIPEWEDVPACMASPSDRQGQGPFFIHDGERDNDINLFRQDIRGQYNNNAEPGTDTHLYLRVLGINADRCEVKPMAGVEVYIWHCDAQGYYSGFGEPGEQNPDISYWQTMKPGPNDLDNDDSFCRGAQITDNEGMVSFNTVFPGWYNGRDIHIHLMVLERGSSSRGRRRYRGRDHIYTTQFYFEPELIDRVHRASQPYLRRTELPAYAGAILGDERGSSGLRAQASFEHNIVTAQMQIVLETDRSNA